MKILNKFFTSFLLILSLCLFVSCGNNEEKPPVIEDVDYVSQAELTKDFNGKIFDNDGIEEVELTLAVDGDTIYVKSANGKELKLRFLGIDTPESTAQVEPWGMAASKFTKERVKNAVSIVITADAGQVELDSYERHLAWVWYKATADSEYVLLNLELAQVGYSLANYSNCKDYKDLISGAITQARRKQIKVWGEKDPDYCYSEAKEVSLSEIKKSLAELGNKSPYFNQKVVFVANVSRKVGQTYYLTDTDLESGITYSIQCYHRTSTGILDVVGTRVKISGTITYYDAASVYQLTDVVDRVLSSNKNNLKIVEENVEIKPIEIDLDYIDNEDMLIEFNLVSLKDLKVKRTYTTKTEGSSNFGAISIYCEINGQEICVRTVVMVDRTGTYEVDKDHVVLASNFENKTIDVVGVLEKYEGAYQIKLVSMDDVVIR